MGDLISRQTAIDAFDGVKVNEENCDEYDIGYNDGIDFAVSKLSVLPSAEPEHTKMIKEIRKWINSGNRGSADYFIVDKIEEIINKYER